jgi:Ca2+-binding RTX toxin-like protein
LIKTSNDLQKVAIGSTLDFNGSTVTTSDLTSQIAPTPVFQSNGGVGGYTLPELFTGPASLNLQYQLIETADNAVVIGGTSNDFIKVASTNSTGKAVDGGGGADVIDGGVGSTFITGGAGGDTFFLDGRAPGVSWSTITDFRTGSDKATIWGFVKGVSSVDTSFTDPNNEGAGGIYNGLTLHFKNLLPSGQTTGANADLNSITLSGRTLADIGVSSLQDLNNQINQVTTANEYGQYIINDHLIIGQTQDAQGTHGYLFVY